MIFPNKIGSTKKAQASAIFANDKRQTNVFWLPKKPSARA
jgi:hypothetical protein